MKRIISISLILLIAILLCSCGGKPEKTSDAMYQIGLNALATADEYIEGKISGTEADEKISEFKRQAEAQVSEERKEIDKDYLYLTDLANDEHISTEITLLSYRVTLSTGQGTMSDVKESRDNLAKTLEK